MLILYRRVEFWVAMLALHRIGAVPVPSPALLTSKDIEFSRQLRQDQGRCRGKFRGRPH